jgi:hypothetical protein
MKLSFDSNSTEMSKGKQVGSMIGALAGTYYAFTNKKSFWGYVGFIILGSFAGSILGNLYETTIGEKKSASPSESDNKPSLDNELTGKPPVANQTIVDDGSDVDRAMANFL